MTDDTNPGGWSDKPGVPLEPHISRFHWVTPGSDEEAFPAEWRAAGECERGRWAEGWIVGDADHNPAGCRYLGPCLLPSEVAALIEAARAEGGRLREVTGLEYRGG
jgi:hypothetical protein